MELFAPLHPPPPSPPPSLTGPPSPPPPSEEVGVLVGLGGAFVKVLVGRGVFVWVAVEVGVSVSVAVAVFVSVAVAVVVGVSVTDGVAVEEAVAVWVTVLVMVGVSDAIKLLIVFEKAQAELKPTIATNTTTPNNRFINKTTFTPKKELSQYLWFDLTPIRGFGGVFIGAADAE
jgi:hypothetical protein